VALENARRKAAAIDGGGALVLACDTVVDAGAELLGKPRDAEQARAFTRALAGREHRVVSGLWVGGEEAVEVTRVRFRPLDDALIDWYVGTGEWEGRAGAYAIQGAGAALVASIAGDYLNVVGLPLARLLDLRPDLLPIDSVPR
jgi:septum formation protein